MEKLGFIGTGNMGTAIIKGIASSQLKNSIEIYAFDKLAEKLEALSRDGVKPCVNEREVVKTCRYVLLAVKPQMLGEVLDAVKPDVTEKTVFISICAGISESFIREHTIPNAKVVLVMPNTPMMLGLGASAMAYDDKTTDEEFAFARSVIGSAGITEVIPISKMKEVIAVHSSAIAFIYLFSKGFIDFAAENGIDGNAAMHLFSQALVGSAGMLTDSGMTVDQLIKQVSSPGGTTLAGLDKLYEGKLVEDVKNACEACTKRAYELGK